MIYIFDKFSPYFQYFISLTLHYYLMNNKFAIVRLFLSRYTNTHAVDCLTLASHKSENKNET